MYPPRVLSVIKPTRSLHLGHYFGIIKRHVELQHRYPGQSFCSLADYHPPAEGFDADSVRQETLDTATIWLALGLDPTKSTIYRQSDVRECMETAWILWCLGSARGATIDCKYEDIGPPCFDPYPFLITSAICSLRATLVPVGIDKREHVEKVGEIVRRFNSECETAFLPVPIPVISETVPGIDGRQMRRTNKNRIFVLGVPGDTFGDENPQSLEGWAESLKGDLSPGAIFHLCSMVSSSERAMSLRAKYEAGSIGDEDLMEELSSAVGEYFSKFRNRYLQLKKDRDFVMDVLEEGGKTASSEARDTLDQMRECFGPGLVSEK